MSNNIFGILNLSSRTVHTNDKGDIFKKFTPYLSHIKPSYVKTKKTTLSDIFCTVCINTKTVLEYYENLSSDNIPLILTKLEWKNCLKKENINNIISIDLTPNRVNLQMISYTIDPDGSLDRDDAIGIDIINKKIYINIADPSSYISKDSAFDKELKNRVQSIYLDKVYHMFPEPLSTNIISLTEGNISRAFTLELSYDESYEILSHKFYKSFVQVKNLTYEQAEDIIQNKLNKDILELYNFGLKQNKSYESYDSHKMVEIFMILCNKFSAIEMKDCKSIIRYNNTSNTSKLDLTNISKSIDSKLLEMYQISNNEAASYEINTELTGHSLLNLEHYTHFSSPLRRYVDLVLHRILYAKITKDEDKIEEIYSEEEIKNICLHVNNINKNYKFAYNIDKLNKLLKDKTILELDCDLVYFNNNLIKLYYKDKEDLLLFVNLIHSKIKDNFIINQENFETDFIITSSMDTEVIKLKLFQKVKIKIFKLKNSIKTYQISFVEPKLELL